MTWKPFCGRPCNAVVSLKREGRLRVQRLDVEVGWTRLVFWCPDASRRWRTAGAVSGVTRVLFGEQFLDCWFHRFGPCPVARFMGMQQVGHDRFWQSSAIIQEGGVQVEEEDALAVRVFLDVFIDGCVKLPQLVVYSRTARKNCQQENFHLGFSLLQFSEDVFDPCGRLLRWILTVSGVIGANHDDGQLWRNGIYFAVLESPDNMFGAVSTIANVKGISFCIIFLPNLLSAAFPTVRNRVADHEQIDRFPFRRFQFLRVAITPPFVAAVFRSDCFDSLLGIVFFGGRQFRSGKGCQQEEYHWQEVESHESSCESCYPGGITVACGGRLCELPIVTQPENDVKQLPGDPAIVSLMTSGVAANWLPRPASAIGGWVSGIMIREYCGACQSGDAPGQAVDRTFAIGMQAIA